MADDEQKDDVIAQRRAQFDDLSAQIEALTLPVPVDNPMTDEQRVTQLITDFKADVLALAVSPAYREWGYGVVSCLFDLCEAMSRRAVLIDPGPAPVLLERADLLCARSEQLREGLRMRMAATDAEAATDGESEPVVH